MSDINDKLNRMAHKKIILKLLELAQELDKTDEAIGCSMIVNDMEKVIDNYVSKQLILHSISGCCTDGKHHRQITEKELKLAVKELKLQYGLINHIINKVRDMQSKSRKF